MMMRSVADVCRVFPPGTEVVYINTRNHAVCGVVDDGNGTIQYVYIDTGDMSFRIRIRCRQDGEVTFCEPDVSRVGVRA
jgi:hypothetical protein